MRVGFGVEERVGVGLEVGSLGVLEGEIVAVTCVGSATVGGRVGNGERYSSIMLHPVTVINIKTKMMIFLCMVILHYTSASKAL